MYNVDKLVKYGGFLYVLNVALDVVRPLWQSYGRTVIQASPTSSHLDTSGLKCPLGLKLNVFA